MQFPCVSQRFSRGLNGVNAGVKLVRRLRLRDLSLIVGGFLDKTEIHCCTVIDTHFVFNIHVKGKFDV